MGVFRNHSATYNCNQQTEGIRKLAVHLQIIIIIKHFTPLKTMITST